VAKSALALEWLALTAHRGFPSLMISREMTIDALARRVLAQQAQVPARRLRSGLVEADDLGRLQAILPVLQAMPLHFDAESASLGQIQRKVARAAQAGTRFVVVDYLQLIRGPKGTDRRLEVEAVSAGLKALAFQHGLAVLALSSLTPPPPGTGNKRPRPDMASLRESRALEHDADIVLLLHRPDPDAPGRELILDKARDGGTGRCALHFEGAYLRFRESAAGPSELPPLDPNDPRNEVPF
jgi:replicative DNA helicase